VRSGWHRRPSSGRSPGRRRGGLGFVRGGQARPIRWGWPRYLCRALLNEKGRRTGTTLAAAKGCDGLQDVQKRRCVQISLTRRRALAEPVQTAVDVCPRARQPAAVGRVNRAGWQPKAARAEDTGHTGTPTASQRFEGREEKKGAKAKAAKFSLTYDYDGCGDSGRQQACAWRHGPAVPKISSGCTACVKWSFDSECKTCNTPLCNLFNWPKITQKQPALLLCDDEANIGKRGSGAPKMLEPATIWSNKNKYNENGTTLAAARAGRAARLCQTSLCNIPDSPARLGGALQPALTLPRCRRASQPPSRFDYDYDGCGDFSGRTVQLPWRPWPCLCL
uniref:RanBP2-type domain-containing protein n=1 Tax=Macrostomum lignano TaxID=282301 RepID=A0A1I8FSY7_9PLAT